MHPLVFVKLKQLYFLFSLLNILQASSYAGFFSGYSFAVVNKICFKSLIIPEYIYI